MKRVAAIGLFLVLSIWAAGSAAAGPLLPSCVVYGGTGVAIGVDSRVTGDVCAGSNNPIFDFALKLNSHATIDGNAWSGGDVNVGNGAAIVNKLTRSPGTVLKLGSGAVVGSDVIANPGLPPIPGPTPITCPTGGPDLTGGNHETLSLTPGSYGDLKYGAQFVLILVSPGEYRFNSITLATNAVFNVVPGAKIIVCGNATMDSVDVHPPTLSPSDFSFEVQGTSDNAFRARCGSDWIGNVFASRGGIHVGSGDCGSRFSGQLLALGPVRIEHAVTVEGPPPPLLKPPQDATLLHSKKNENNGANDSVRVAHQVAGIFGFDVSGAQGYPDFATVTSATLRLRICYTPADPTICPDPSSGWPAGGDKVFAYRLKPGIIWTEGNGNNFPIPDNPHGAGPGTTWNCATDADVANQSANCKGADAWKRGGENVQEEPAVGFALITNAMADGTIVDIDVTDALKEGLGLDTIISFFVRRDQGTGQVSFYSQEGAAKVGQPYTPRLIITP